MIPANLIKPTHQQVEIDQRRDILASTMIRPADDSTRAYRFVLRLLRGNTVTPYVVHTETDPFEPQAAFHAGNYCENMEEAFAALAEKSYRERLSVLDFNGNRVARK